MTSPVVQVSTNRWCVNITVVSRRLARKHIIGCQLALPKSRKNYRLHVSSAALHRLLELGASHARCMWGFFYTYHTAWRPCGRKRVPPLPVGAHTAWLPCGQHFICIILCFEQNDAEQSPNCCEIYPPISSVQTILPNFAPNNAKYKW